MHIQAMAFFAIAYLEKQGGSLFYTFLFIGGYGATREETRVGKGMGKGDGDSPHFSFFLFDLCRDFGSEGREEGEGIEK